MKTNSVSYIIGFCTLVCLVCSVFVASSAVGLKDIQEKNKTLDRQKKVLIVAGLMKEGESKTAKEVQAIFSKRIRSVVVDLQKGVADKSAPKDFDQLKASKDPKTSKVADKNLAGILRMPLQALVYLVSKVDMEAGKGFQLFQYILPVEGKGLWSTLYGFIALAPDFNEVKGLTFYQHAETPGLGGEVDNANWKAKWIGRMVFGKKGSDPSQWKKVKLHVIKGLAESPKNAPHKVDGLSGATITSKGVTHLIQHWLGKDGFGNYIQNKLNKKTAYVKEKTEVKKIVPQVVQPIQKVEVKKVEVKKVEVKKVEVPKISSTTKTSQPSSPSTSNPSTMQKK